MKKKKSAPAKAKKPAAKAAPVKAKKKAPAKTSAKPTSYTPPPIQGIGWAPFRYPLT